MSRISRNKIEPLSPSTEKIYNTALYARISKEDSKTNGNSIENQIYMLEQYVQNKPYFKLCATYLDSGITGTTFNRPGFNALMDDIRSGKINCIVVKDLSRFGRNYIKTGDYIETIFPAFGVRFISINDDFDSICVDSTDTLVLSFKGILHAAYAKDISKKVCTSLNIKKKNGNYLGRFAPFGYKKSINDKHKLQIDENTRDIIASIFNMHLYGMGVTAIAQKLNDMGTLNPERYLLQQGLVKPTIKREKSLWHGSSVTQILSNPIYMGAIVERKSDSAFYKGAPKKALPKCAWNIIYNTHQPIISREIFEQIQKKAGYYEQK